MFKIWNGPKKPKPELYLKLHQGMDVINLEVVDEYGRRKAVILAINKDGTLQRFGCMDHAIGLSLDDNGAIRLSDDDGKDGIDGRVWFAYHPRP